MLRRKLLMTLALLTLLMLGTALSSVLLMQKALGDLEHINNTTITDATVSSSLGKSLATIEAELLRWSQSSTLDTDLLNNSRLSMKIEIEKLRSDYSSKKITHAKIIHLTSAWSNLDRSLDSVIAASANSKASHAGAALASTNLMRQSILNHTDFAFANMRAEQQDHAAVFRMFAISLAAVFVVLINAFIIILMKTASSVLKPVDSLVEASRHLAREEYHYRVDTGQNGEFAELAEAFNHLAMNLESNEQRKLETLQQVARTLNHELNNAIAIIELQLRMVANSPDYDHASGKQLKLIHDTLHQMNNTVTSLSQVRRVVLTDYTEGVQMLDLKLSTQRTPPLSPPPHVESDLPDEAAAP